MADEQRESRYGWVFVRSYFLLDGSGTVFHRVFCFFFPAFISKPFGARCNIQCAFITIVQLLWLFYTAENNNKSILMISTNHQNRFSHWASGQRSYLFITRAYHNKQIHRRWSIRTHTNTPSTSSWGTSTLHTKWHSIIEIFRQSGSFQLSVYCLFDCD